MSASSHSLKNPILIGAIILGGIAVTVLNINTFGPGAKPTRRIQASAQNQPALPPDLAILVQEAMTGGNLTSVTGPVEKQNQPSLDRDPFLTDTKPVAKTPSDSSQPKSVRKAGLVCSAIMTGSKRPSALINGKFYSPGDKLYGYTLAWIATNGVTLQNSQGAKKFLPLAIKGQRSGALRVDMGPRSSGK